MKRVELLNVSKTYDQQTNVVTDINVCIEPGEFFVLVGPSGCGKSTMLRMIAGLETISDGVIRIGDVEANHLPPNKRDLSMVFQNYALYPHLTVEQNIAFHLHINKVPKKERIQRTLDIAELLGLTPYLKRKPRALSGGQRQRVALARAIVSNASICLMDEPLSNLDAKLRAKMRSEIKQIQRQFNITMIYVTHDQVEAMTMGDRMMILHDGKIQQIGKPIDIYNSPANPFVATFIGSPPMNMAPGVIDFEKSMLMIGNSLRVPIPAKSLKYLTKHQVTVGIRPEAMVPPNAETLAGHSKEYTITNVELLGNETLISFQMEELQWMAKWSGQWAFTIGEKIPIAVDFEDLCLFDKETESLLKSPSSTVLGSPRKKVVV